MSCISCCVSCSSSSTSFRVKAPGAPEERTCNPNTFLTLSEGSRPPRTRPSGLTHFLPFKKDQLPSRFPDTQVGWTQKAARPPSPRPSTTQGRGRGRHFHPLCPEPLGSHRQARRTERTQATHTAAQVTEALNTPGHASTPQSMLGHGPREETGTRWRVHPHARTHLPVPPAAEQPLSA